MRSLIPRFGRRKGRADPAPSRWGWRIERMMMTPAIRLALRAGVPFAMSLGFGLWWLSDEDRRMAIQDTVTEARAEFEQRPEFMVKLMSVTGAGDEVAADIREIMPIEFPVSSFELDLEQIRLTIAELDPIKDVRVRIRPGGILDVHITERIPVAVWRSYGTVTLVDETGAHVASVPSRLSRPDLPLIAGDGADKHVREALSLLRAAEPLGDRLRGLVRIGERRWDVVLDREQRILLPEYGAARALDRVIAIDSAQDLLARDVARIDLRLAERPTVKMNGNATQEWWRIQALSALEN